jgi:hypothetical protein
MAQSNKSRGKGRKLTVSEGAVTYRTEYVIDDDTPNDEIFNPVINGQVMTHGLVPRDYSIYPRQMFAPPADMPLLDTGALSAICKEQEEQQSSLEHLMNRKAVELGIQVPYLHQNGHGYCWAYSTGNCVMLDRLARNLPYIRLNPHAVAAIIKSGRDEGGWCGLSAKFYSEVGCPTEDFWKVHSRDLKQDTAEMRANAAKHKILEDWVDLVANIYDRNLTDKQWQTCLASNIPCPTDWDEMSHSMCAGRLREIERGYFRPRVFNSWLQWGDNGWGTIARNWTVDSCLAIRATGASVK